MNIVIFGGAFDPMTYAHLYIINTIVADNVIDHVFIEVANDVYKSIVAPWRNRAKMVELALDNLEHNSDKVKLGLFDAHEYFNRQPYTYETFEFYEHASSIKNIYGVIGSDQLANWDSWMKSDELAKRYRWFVFERDEDNAFKIIDNNPILKKYKKHFLIYPYGSDISSSEVRFRLRLESADILLNQMIPQNVLDYIKENKLYVEKDNDTL